MASCSSDSDHNVSLARVSKALKSKSTKLTTKDDGSETKELRKGKVNWLFNEHNQRHFSHICDGT